MSAGHVSPRVLDSWHSDRVGRRMPIVRYGDFGRPLLMFPTAAADHLEYERFRLIDALAPFIAAGVVNVFSIDSINKDAWLNEDIHPAQRAERQVAYDAYVREEVVPYIHAACRTPGIPIVTTGASFGAFHAMNTLLKHPDVFDGVIAMSGCFDIRSSCDGWHDMNVYFNNPIEYVPNLRDERVLEQLRRARITIATGEGAYEQPAYSREMAEVLGQIGVPVRLDLWGKDVAHDWPTWNRMLERYVPEYFT